MTKFEFNAETRNKVGSGFSRKLRRQEQVPGIFYGAEIKSQPITMSHHQMYYLLRNEEFQASIIDMNLDGKKHQVLLRNFQFHPYKQKLLHLDFQQVSDKKEIRKSVPLHFINASESPGVKLHHGIASHTVIEIEISCLPKNLPTHIDIDMSSMNVGDSIHALDIELPDGVKLTISGSDNPVICQILAPMKEEEIEETPVEAEIPTEPSEETKSPESEEDSTKE